MTTDTTDKPAKAAARGVQRLVLLTGRGHGGAQLSEHAVQQAGADWTIVRSSFFAQDFSEDEAFVDSVRSGMLVFPWGQAAEPSAKRSAANPATSPTTSSRPAAPGPRRP